MARAKVTDPDGLEWRVWRRWYVWRRRIMMRDVWKALPGTSGDGRNSATGGDSISDFIEFIVALPFLLLAALGLVVTLVDLAFQLIALPFALLARLVRLTSWPVQLDREDKHIRTLRVKGFGRAGALRDEQVALAAAGRVPAPALPDASGTPETASAA